MSNSLLIMDPELQINLPDSDDLDLYGDLSEMGHPPAMTKQSDNSQASQQSQLH